MAKKKVKKQKQESLMTLTDVAQFLQVADRTVYLWAQKGSIPSFKLGNVWRFKRSDLEAWFDRRKNETKRTNAS